MDRQKRKNIRRSYVKSFRLGFSLLEVLIASLLSIVIAEIIAQTLIINYKITRQSQHYLEMTLNSQYLYGLLTASITNNIGIYNLEQNIDILTNENKKDCLHKLISKNHDLQKSKVTVIHGNQLKNDKYLLSFFKKVNHRANLDSDVLLVQTMSLEKSNNHENISTVVHCEQLRDDISTSIFYVADSSLYLFKKNRSDELVSGVSRIQVNKLSKPHADYYIFKIWYLGSGLKPAVFAIKNNLWHY